MCNFLLPTGGGFRNCLGNSFLTLARTQTFGSRYLPVGLGLPREWGEGGEKFGMSLGVPEKFKKRSLCSIIGCCAESLGRVRGSRTLGPKAPKQIQQKQHFALKRASRAWSDRALVEASIEVLKTGCFCQGVCLPYLDGDREHADCRYGSRVKVQKEDCVHCITKSS